MRTTLPARRLTVPLLLCAQIAVAGCKSSSPAIEGDLDPLDMDRSVSPAEDFYRYANGGWLDRTEIPPEKAAWSVGAEVNERNQDLLLELLEQAGTAGDAPPGSVAQKLGDFWATGMDTEALAAQGVDPLAPALARIEAIDGPESFARTVAALHRIGVGVLFSPGVEAGLENPDVNMAWVTQGGLGLPDRDYYTRDDAESEEQRRLYLEHVSRMLQHLGDSREVANAGARSVVTLETRMAESSMPRVELNNPQNWNRKVATEETIAAMPHFDWPTYLTEIGFEVDELNQPMPEFFEELDVLLDKVPLGDWKTYMRWHLVHALAGALSPEIEQENFAFFGQTLAGVEEMEPRWKRVLGQTSGALGEALGQLYVERAFSPEAKARALAMVQELLGVMGERIERVAWMGPETKAQALEKLSTFGIKIGYPDEWRDYSKLEIRRDSYAANVMRAAEHEFRWQVSRCGQPIDRNEWGMTPQTLNAYYNPLRNEIVFPAAILQPPFFSAELDDPLNYGAIGAVIGHEITHGFDNSGSQFDAQGRLRNWWTDDDRAEFDRRTQKLVEQYSAVEILPGVPIDGELTLGENIADLGGLSIAFEAMQRASADAPDPMLGGFTREQRFFLAFQRVWRNKTREEALKLQVRTDVHAPARARATCPLANLQTFADAFELPADAPALLPREARAEIW